jgi:hypothetical protein
VTPIEVLDRFESLGGGSLRQDGWGFGCEFGFFARSYGDERGSLLRWGSIDANNLIRALRARFGGVDDITAFDMRDGGQQWHVIQTTYGMRFDHTGISSIDFSSAQAAQRISKIFRRLRDRLVEDLDAGDRLFLYRTHDHTLDGPMLGALSDAMAGYGSATLCYLQVADAENEPFTAQRRSPNLIVSYIDRFAPCGTNLVLNNRGWELCCRAVLNLLDTEREARGERIVEPDRSMRHEIALTINFGTDGNAQEYQVGGWYGPEPTHTWTDGYRSEIRFPAPHAPFGYFIEIETGCLIKWPERPSQPLIVYVDGKSVSILSIDQGGVYSAFCLPPSGPTVTISFAIPGAIRMSEIRDQGDPRLLGLSLRRIRVMSLLAPRAAMVHRSAAHQVSGNGLGMVLDTASHITGISTHDLLTRFEMLCGDCWFGLTQRLLGAEPLGLLRFAGANPRVTIELLDTAFEAMGRNISAEPSPNGANEWMVRDAAGLYYHSGRPLAVSSEDVLKQERNKIQFLRSKMLQDLVDAEKIFLFVDCHGYPPEAAMSIFLALRRVSTASMLWIRSTPFGEAHGSVTEIVPGLLMGFMDFRGAPIIDNNPIGGWLSVLTAAYKIQSDVRIPNLETQ